MYFPPNVSMPGSLLPSSMGHILVVAHSDQCRPLISWRSSICGWDGRSRSWCLLAVSLGGWGMGAARQRQFLAALLTLVHRALEPIRESNTDQPHRLLPASCLSVSYFSSLHLGFVFRPWPARPSTPFSPWSIPLHPSWPRAVINVCGKHSLILAYF